MINFFNQVFLEKKVVNRRFYDDAPYNLCSA